MSNWQVSYEPDQLGAIYRRDFSDGSAEQMILPEYVIKKIGYIPSAEIACLIVGLKKHAENGG